MSEMLFMIDRNRRDGADRRFEHICRVEPSAEPDLDHRDFRVRASEDLEAHRGRCLEERWWSGNHSIFLQAIGAVQDVARNIVQGVVVDRRIADDEALAEVNEVWR